MTQPPRILNLNFHGIGRPIGRDFGEGERELWAKHETFEAALDLAAAQRDAIRLSFDDGNSTDIDVALPALQQRDLTATFFIVPGWLGEPGRMTKADLKDLVAAGMTIGNHGLHHHRFTELDRPSLEHEVRSGRLLLEELTGTTPTTLAIPFGDYDEFVLDVLQRDAYTHVFTSDGGTAAPEDWLQPREHVRTDHSPAALQSLVSALTDAPGSAL